MATQRGTGTGGIPAWVWIAIAAIVLIVLALLLIPGLTGEDATPAAAPAQATPAAAPAQATPAAAAPGAAPAGVMSASDVRDDSDRFIGQTVTVRDDVNEVISPTAFTIGGGLLEDSMLVLVPQNVTAQGVTDDVEVQVRGTIERFDRAAMETQHNLTLPAGTFDQYQDDPVLIANQVTVVQEGAAATPGAGAAATPGAGGAAAPGVGAAGTPAAGAR
jgi:hypothetical protein